MAIRLVPNEYIVGAHALGIVRARVTVRNLPKPPVGARIAETSPPKLFPFWLPASQEGVERADAAKATPNMFPVT